MKKFFLFIILFGLFPDFGLAQEDTTMRHSPVGEDTALFELPAERKQSKITLLKDQILGTNYWEEEFKGNWTGIFVGVNGLAKTDYSGYPESRQDFFEPDLLRSYVVNINLLQFSQGLQRSRNTIGLVTGVGLELQSWNLDDHITVSKGANLLEPVELTYDNPRKSKLNSSYLSVPLLAEFQIPMKQYGNRIYFSGGIIISKRLSSHTKVKYTDQDKEYKLKSTDDYYLRDFRTSATFRMGYRWINLFGTYDLQQIFLNKKGPKAYPFSVGFALISF